MSTSPACSQALGLPEIVAAILEQLKNYRDLFAAVQVNKLWADEATTILWRDDPPIQTIGRIGDVEKLQYYANKIRHLWGHTPPATWTDSHRLQYPRLSYLSTHIDDDEGEQSVLHYLRPSLRRIACYWSKPISDSILMQIEARCPALQILELRRLQETSISYDLLRFLIGMPSLTHLELPSGLENVELCIHLASRPNLQKLSVPPNFRLAKATTWTEDHTMEILAKITNPFPKLECVAWCSQGQAFHGLAPHLFGLKDLQIILVETCDDIFFAISSCINLATVTVTFEKKSRVSGKGFLAIAKKCPHLHSFRLCVKGSGEVDGRSITDDVIRQVGTYLPAMTHLCICRMKTDLTIEALLHLGDLCTELKECSLSGIFDLERLCRPDVAPSFTRLEYLMLRCIPDNISRARAFSIVHQLAPHARFYSDSFHR